MRELRQNNIQASVHELQVDKLNMEDLSTNLRGLKQEGVFSYLGRNNLTAAETEDLLKAISPAGIGSCEQLPVVDSEEIDRLDSLVSGPSAENSTENVTSNVSPLNSDHNSNIHSTVYTNEIYQEGYKSWPTCYSSYSASSLLLEGMREEEIVATNIAEEVVCPESFEESELKVNDAYIVQNSLNAPDTEKKSKSLKLVIKKRLESDDEKLKIPVTREKSQRKRQPSVRLGEILEIPSRRRCRPKKSCIQREKRVEKVNMESRLETELEGIIDFPLANTARPDDDYVYPSLEMSDEESADVYQFDQRDDETWVPSMRIKSTDTKTSRTAQNSRKNSAINNYSGTASHKILSPLSNFACQSLKNRFRRGSGTSKSSITDLTMNEDLTLTIPEFLRNPSFNRPPPAPSTSQARDVDYEPPSSFLHTLSSSDETSDSETFRKRKAPSSNVKNKFNIMRKPILISKMKSHKQVSKQMADQHPFRNLNLSNLEKTDGQHRPILLSTCAIDSQCASNVSKRGRPRKGMATAKQRLGKILKMHKMRF